ncbi:MAG: hypothetical protein P0S93_04210 [Candidatus Neptunochlamydia sp.]|nr:hypothetical protein [Candidatus Neptunochlamydia sp.]
MGNWELDTIVGFGKSGAIISIIDRASYIIFDKWYKTTKLAKVSQKRAEQVKNALVKNLEPIQDFVLTVTQALFHHFP